MDGVNGMMVWMVGRSGNWGRVDRSGARENGWNDGGSGRVGEWEREGDPLVTALLVVRSLHCSTAGG